MAADAPNGGPPQKISDDAEAPTSEGLVPVDVPTAPARGQPAVAKPQPAAPEPPHVPRPWPDFPEQADPLVPFLPPAQDSNAAPADPPELTSASGQPGIAKGTKLGRYFILDKLGEGGMGVVYAAYDPELDRKIALKILSARFSRSNKGSSAQARLLREAQAMARVSHPNVIAVHDVGMVNDQIFVAMELVDGGTLNRWFRDTPRTWREILHTFVEAGKGLSAAHAAGLVHRDFKPDNVLISKDGRVRVTDFGLARLVTGGPDEEHVSSPPEAEPVPRTAEDSARMLETPLTQVGAVMGTPAYMSPEQHLGRVPDARSDQFSFCAALYWALFRKRPFDPQVLAVIAGRSLGVPAADGTKVERPNLVKERSSMPGKGIILDPPKEPKIPKWLKRALMRGLAIAPDERFPTMEALLAQLKRDPRVIPRRYVLWATGAVVASLIAITYQQVRQRQELCSGAELKLAGVWDEEVRRDVDKIFQGVRQPWAAQASSKVAERFDAQAREWAAMHKEACEATRIRGEQSEQLLSLRMICLDRRLGEFRALSELIRRDPAVLEKAVDAAYALTSVKTCADVAALLAPVPRPDDPKVRDRVARIENQLAEVKAQLDSGKFKQALDEARAAAADARETRFAPVEAEALNQLGWLQDVTGDPKGGEKTLRQAILAAEAGRHDLERLDAMTRLIWTVGYSQRRFDEAQEWVAAARALLTRLGGNPEFEMDVLAYDGSVLVGQGRYDDAVDRFRRAIELTDQYLPAEHPRRSALRAKLAVVYTKRGDLAEASKLDEDALAAIERLRGPDYPSLAYVHYNLAVLRRDTSDFTSAHRHIERALQIFRNALGPNHSMVAASLDILATILQKEGRYAEALAEAQKSLEIRQKLLGPDHPDVAYSYENIGQAFLGLGKAADALAPLEKAIALKERHELDASELAEPRFALARALWIEKRDRKRAHALALSARDGYAKAGNMGLATEVATWLQDHP